MNVFPILRLEDENIKKIMDERKREKQEEKIARDRVKAQIEADKLARKKLFGQVSGHEQPKQVLPAATSSQKESKDYTETKLQVIELICSIFYSFVFISFKNIKFYDL